MRTRRRAKGFTIVEAMLAMVLLLVGILAVAQLFMAAIFVSQKGENLAIAENTITARFEQMRKTRFDRLCPPPDGDFPPTFDVTDPADSNRKVGTGQITMTPLGTTARVMQVTISVQIGWVRGSRTGLSSTTYIAER